MTSSIHNFAVRAGNSGTTANETGLVLNLLVGDQPFDLTGQGIVFRVMKGKLQVLRKDLNDDVIVENGTDREGVASPVPNRIVIPITVANSRTLETAGRALTYEVERRPPGGAQRVIIAGRLTVELGASDD